MIRKIHIRTRFKRFALIILSVLTALTLTSCSTSERDLSTINGDSVYAKSGSYTITNAELWKELRWFANDILEEEITSLVLSKYVDEIKEVISTPGDSYIKERYLDALELYAAANIYSTKDGETAKKLEAPKRELLEKKFIDSYYVSNGVTLSREEFFDEEGLELITGKKYYLSKIYDEYYIKLAEKVLAYYKLKDKVEEYNKDKDKEDDFYYNPTEIIQYHLENYKFDVDTEAIIVRFINDEEVQTTFKAFGIKSYKSNYYFIPQAGLSVEDYSKYYDEFDVSLASNSAKCFNINSIGGETAILQLFVEVRNFIYTYRKSLTNGSIVSTDNMTKNRRNITQQIVTQYLKSDVHLTPEEFVQTWDQEDIDSITYSKKDFDDISVGFAVYVGNTLKIEDNDEAKIRYTSSPYTLGDYTYLIYKVSSNKLTEDNILCAEDDDVITNLTLKDQLIDEMTWAEITDTSSTDALDEEVSKVKVYIFEEAIEITFAQKNNSYSKTHKKAPTKDTLFTIKYGKESKSVKINEVFEKLEKESGTTTAVDLLSKKIIRDTVEYKNITADEIETYEDNLETILALFANDQLSSQGYSASIGKYNFLMLYFHTADVNEIIKGYYMINRASSKILTNYTSDDTIFNLMLKYAQEAYEKSFSLSASNLLAYVDMDEDGVPDKDFDWSTLVPGESVTYAQKTLELINYIINRLKNTSGTQLSLLTTLVEEYESCQRFTNGIDIYDPESDEYDPTEPETLWATYRRAGIYLKIETYDEVTNKSLVYSNDGASTISLPLKTRLKEIYNSDDFKIFNNQYQSEYVDTSYYSNGEGFKTENGFNLLIVSSATAKSSAKFEASDDINGIFTNIAIAYEEGKIEIIEDLYNSSDIVSINQVRLFIYEYVYYETTTLFPTKISSALTDYLLPVYEKYNDDSSRIELSFAKILNKEIEFTNSSNAERFNNIREINQRSSDGYLEDDDLGNIFTGWWNEILKGGSN